MSDKVGEDRKKVDAYLSIIEDRILAPMQSTGIRHYCTATLLVLFAAIDGLGKLLVTDDEDKPNRRICGFLNYMGGSYAVHQKQLWKLRNSLVHNAINVESFLSNTEIRDIQHLRIIGAAGFIYVNTSVMYEDFVDAFMRFRADIQDNPAMLTRAADRLEWREDLFLDDLNLTHEATPSPPPPVQFIYAK